MFHWYKLRNCLTFCRVSVKQCKPSQTISFLSCLKYFRALHGPHLIVVHKSTLQNWAREFERWAPDVNVVVLTGSEEERGGLISNRLIQQDFNVCHLLVWDLSCRKKIGAEEIFVRIYKNVDSILAQIDRAFMSRGRLLITGTPLQNILKRLIALLNFICPEIFSDYSNPTLFYKDEAGADGEEEKSKKVVEALHKVLRPTSSQV